MPGHAPQRPYTRKIKGFSHLALLQGAGKVSVQGDTSSSCSQACAVQLRTVTQITVSAKGISWCNKYCSRIPALRGTACSDAHLVLLLEFQDLSVSTRKASGWPILSLISPTVGSCHFPMAQGITEEEQGNARADLLMPWVHRADPSDEEVA